MHLWRSLPFALALVFSSGSALAQPKKNPIAAAKKEAIVLADQGVEAFRSAQYQEAIESFKRADRLFHVPKFLLYIARSQAKLGKLIEAKATYQGVVDEKLLSYAPEEFFAAQADAQREMVELEKRIPTLKIKVNGVSERRAATVTLDGAVLAAADLGKALPRNPGAHALVATATGRPQITRTVNLREGGSESVTLEMGVATVPVPTATAAVSGDAAPSGAAAVPSALAAERTGKPESGIPTLTIAAYGVGAAGLAAGAVFGGLALSKHDEYNAAPTHEALDQGRLFALISDIGFGTAVVGAAAGTIYWMVSRSRGASAALPAKGSWSVSPAFGAAGGGLSVSGRFE